MNRKTRLLKQRRKKIIAARYERKASGGTSMREDFDTKSLPEFQAGSWKELPDMLDKNISPIEALIEEIVSAVDAAEARGELNHKTAETLKIVFRKTYNTNVKELVRDAERYIKQPRPEPASTKYEDIDEAFHPLLSRSDESLRALQDQPPQMRSAEDLLLRAVNRLVFLRLAKLLTQECGRAGFDACAASSFCQTHLEPLHNNYIRQVVLLETEEIVVQDQISVASLSTSRLSIFSRSVLSDESEQEEEDVSFHNQSLR